jgi:translation initiation factor 1 (eIF-1/SUI1)
MSDSLRKKATIKIQQEAATRGATVVLIQGDDFRATLINNVNLLGVAYK